MKNGLMIMLILLLAFAQSHAQEAPQQPQIQVIRGQISEINWAASSIVVRWLQAEGYVSYDEISILVPDNASITRGSETIGLADLQVGDPGAKTITVKWDAPATLDKIKETLNEIGYPAS